MPISETSTAAVETAAATLSLAQFFTISASAANPAYVVVCALDRNEYTVTANGNTGIFQGNGNTLGFSATGGDGDGAGIVFTWQKSTGQYTNAIYGALNALTYTSSSSPNDVTNISLFGTASATLAQQYANNAYGLMQNDAPGYIGSATIATQPGYSAEITTAATPDGVAAAALSFVGDAWNDNGCWVLASTIAAEAGAGLPVQSTALGIAGKPNGEWIVAYNGPTTASANWQNMVTEGDIVVFTPAGGGGHITTCVSGSGSTAMLVDNITYENSRGHITNLANDGSASDIVVSAPHPASQEFSGVAASSVVIYQLDTPVIADKLAAYNLVPGKSIALSTLFAESDPAGRAVTQYQVYDTLSGDSITLNGHANTAQSAGTAITATSLAALGLLSSTGDTGGTDTIDLRAYNGAYWGDWQTMSVTLNDMPPVRGAQTANQTWLQGSHVNFALPSALFTDPQGQALTYSVTGAGGSSLPGWLNFAPATRAFTGTVPAGLETLPIIVTATDTGGLSSCETFTVNVPAAAPVLTDKTAAQTWAGGKSVSLSLPADSFTDPQGQTLITRAALSSGAALPSWLSFSANSLTFTGTAPATAQSLQLKITATDSSGLSASETIAVTIAKAASGLILAADWTNATPEAAPLPAAGDEPAWMQPQPRHLSAATLLFPLHPHV